MCDGRIVTSHGTFRGRQWDVARLQGLTPRLVAITMDRLTIEDFHDCHPPGQKDTTGYASALATWPTAGVKNPGLWHRGTGGFRKGAAPWAFAKSPRTANGLARASGLAIAAEDQEQRATG
jgi:hypothetical protein